MKRFWWLGILTLCAGPALAAPQCELILESPGVRAEECAGPEGKELSIRLGAGGGFGLRAEYERKNPDGMFRKVGPLGESRALSAADQTALKAAVARAGEERLSAEARTLVKFLTQFAEPGYRPKAKDLSGLLARRQVPALTGTHLLCEKLGRPHTGYFTARGQAWKQTMVLGSHGCMGKCGPGCAPDGQWDRGTYTQECFNHDLCCTMTGDNMGDCEDEFWEAASGFLSAPHCMFVERRRG